MKRAITEQDIDRLVKDGKLVVTREMLLTPAAREYLSRRGISVEYETNTAHARERISEGDLASIIEQVVMEELSSPESSAHNADMGTEAQAPREVPAVQKEGESDHRYLGRVLDSLHQSDVTENRAIVTVVGQNSPGIVARISTAVAQCGGDLADMNQVIVGDYFSLIFVVNLGGLELAGSSFRLFKERLQNEASSIGCVKTLVMHEDIFKAMHKV